MHVGDDWTMALSGRRVGKSAALERWVQEMKDLGFDVMEVGTGGPGLRGRVDLHGAEPGRLGPADARRGGGWR